MKTLLVKRVFTFSMFFNKIDYFDINDFDLFLFLAELFVSYYNFVRNEIVE